LPTVVCSCDATRGYRSSSPSSYVRDVGWRSLSDALANRAATTSTKGQSWRGAVPGAQRRTAGGDCGEPTPETWEVPWRRRMRKQAEHRLSRQWQTPSPPAPPICSIAISSLTAAEGETGSEASDIAAGHAISRHAGVGLRAYGMAKKPACHFQACSYAGCASTPPYSCKPAWLTQTQKHG